MDNRNEILRILRESGTYVSGQELSERFNISRTAVWKHIRALEDEGYRIEAVNRRGYRLTAVPDTIAEREVGSRMTTVRMGRRIRYFASIDSTNRYAKHLAETDDSCDGTLIIADEQTEGRGRGGRHWVTPPKEAVACSIILRPRLAPERISMVTLVMGLAVTCAFNSLYGMNAGIKWPNDVVSHGRKLCGILTEMSAEIGQIHYIVIGVGINANLTAFPEEIRQVATSLKLELGHEVNRAELIAEVMSQFERLYAVFESSQSLKDLRDEYNSACLNMNASVRVLDPKGEYTGTARGIDDDGALMVELDDGSIRAVSSGEVSVRGIYGYV